MNDTAGHPDDSSDAGAVGPGAELLEAVLALHHALAALDRRAATRLGLSAMDHTCLELIHRHPHITPTQLAHRLDIPATTMAGRLSRLERDGWIRRLTRPEDKRSVELSLSPTRRRQVHDHVRPVVAAIATHAGHSATTPEVIATLRELTRIVDGHTDMPFAPHSR